MSVVIKQTIEAAAPLAATTFLAEHASLSKELVKKVMRAGGVWVKRRGTGKLVRLRRATATLSAGDYVELYYDKNILSRNLPEGIDCVFENEHYGVWFKPPGVLSEGTQFGDHCSILRYVEKLKKKAFLVHRLDREASGLIIIAYTKDAAARFSKMFQTNETEHQIEKIYHVWVQGLVQDEEGEIEELLDGKAASTGYKKLETKDNSTLLEVVPKTGRLHQIRKHLAGIGHPVIGDPRYGSGNKNNAGLKLCAYSLAFVDPFEQTQRCYVAPQR